jgi:hypothetical protein
VMPAGLQAPTAPETAACCSCAGSSTAQIGGPRSFENASCVITREMGKFREHRLSFGAIPTKARQKTPSCSTRTIYIDGRGSRRSVGLARLLPR